MQCLEAGKEAAEKIWSDLDKDGFECLWRSVKKHGLTATRQIRVDIVSGLVSVFLNMVKLTLGWDPDTAEGRRKCLSLFQGLPRTITPEMADDFLVSSFRGPEGVKTGMEIWKEYQARKTKMSVRS
jgi:hypothetical protein